MPNEELTTLAAAKASIGETGSDDDTELGRILDATEAAIGKFCRRNYQGSANALTSFEATEHFSGSGQADLWLPRFPVTAISALYVDQNGYYGHGASAFPADSEWTIGESFVPADDFADLSSKGRLVSLWNTRGGLFGAEWPVGVGNIKITYTAGFATIPDDLVQAVHQLFGEFAARFRNDNKPMMQSETHGRYSYTLLTQDTSKQMAHVRSLLLAYRDKS